MASNNQVMYWGRDTSRIYIGGGPLVYFNWGSILRIPENKI